MRPATITAAMAVAMLFVVSALAPGTQAAPIDKELAELEKKTKKLEKKATKLTKEYRGEIISLKEAQTAAKNATKQVKKLDEALKAARAAIGHLALDTYTNPAPYVTVVAADDPDEMLRNAARASQITVAKNTRIEQIDSLTAQASSARTTADGEVRKLQEEVENLESQRDRVRKLLKKYKEETAEKEKEKKEKEEEEGDDGGDDGGGGGGGMRRGPGESPLVGNTMTPRMRAAYEEIDRKFGRFPTIGCYRDGDPQDHGSGRACDFMESTGGRMPAAKYLRHGDAVAQYVIDNADRLGMKYVIWKQRIWDVRSSGGWRAMEDRGSITANHYDHIHVSVF